MNLNRYHELLIHNNVFPVGLNNHLLILSKNGKLIVEIFCLPIKEFIEDFNNYKSRLIVNVYSSANLLPNSEVMQVQRCNALIMLECQESNTAYTYEISINEEERTVMTRLCDMPELGKSLITDVDIIGVKKKVWTQTAKKYIVA